MTTEIVSHLLKDLRIRFGGRLVSIQNGTTLLSGRLGFIGYIGFDVGAPVFHVYVQKEDSNGNFFPDPFYGTQHLRGEEFTLLEEVDG